MNLLTLNVTKKILETVDKNNGLLTSHNIAVRMDRRDDVDTIPPPLYILKELTNHGYLEMLPLKNKSYSKYKITNKGLLLLKSFTE